jgi:hypothetical protein
MLSIVAVRRDLCLKDNCITFSDKGWYLLISLSSTRSNSEAYCQV